METDIIISLVIIGISFIIFIFNVANRKYRESISDFDKKRNTYNKREIDKNIEPEKIESNVVTNATDISTLNSFTHLVISGFIFCLVMVMGNFVLNEVSQTLNVSSNEFSNTTIETSYKNLFMNPSIIIIILTVFIIIFLTNFKNDGKAL